MTTVRAYSTLDKIEKRQEILMSAEDLFIKQKGVFPTVSAICTYSSIAKGTIYLYFKSKESIYLALAENYFEEWFSSKNINTDKVSIDSVIDNLLSYVLENPHKFKLLSQNHLLEIDTDSNESVNFYSNLMTWYNELADFIASFLDASPEKAKQWLLDVYFYIQGSWRTANPNPELKAAMTGTPLEAFIPNFIATNQRVLKLLWENSSLD